MKQLWKLRLRKRPSSYFDSLLSLLCPKKIYMDTSNVHKNVKKKHSVPCLVVLIGQKPEIQEPQCPPALSWKWGPWHTNLARENKYSYRLYNPWRGGGSDIHQTIHFLLNIQRSNPTSSYCGSLLLSNFHTIDAWNKLNYTHANTESFKPITPLRPSSAHLRFIWQSIHSLYTAKVVHRIQNLGQKHHQSPDLRCDSNKTWFKTCIRYQ